MVKAGFKEENLRFRDHSKEELSFYADEVRIRNLNWCIDEITKALSDNEKEENFVSDKKEDNTDIK